MSNSKHQLIEYSNSAGFDNNIDPSTKSNFGIGELVVVCRDKNSLISLRSLKVNNYDCPFCLKKLNSDLAIIGNANINGEGEGKKYTNFVSTPRPSGIAPILWVGMAGVMLFCLLFAGIGIFAGLWSGGTSAPVPIPTRARPTSTTVLSQPRPTNTARSTPRPEPTKTLINNNSNFAEISCAEIHVVNLRRTPGYVGKNDETDSLSEVPCGEIVELLGSSRKVDGLTWWNVSWNGYTGWIADHTGSGKVILDFNP